MADILVADDTKSIRSTLKILLEEEGWSVRLAQNGDEVLAEYSARRPDLLLLDIMMPRKNGYQVLGRIRETDPSLPIMFLSARGSSADISLGLDLGADDYLPKPFDDAVLVSRIRAIFRRLNGAPPPQRREGESGAARQDEEGNFRMGGHVVDVRRYALVGPDGASEGLSAREIKILRMLASRPGEVVTRDSLISTLWGYATGVTTRTVDQHILVLRKKLGSDASLIETVHGSGYRCRATPVQPGVA